MLEFYDVSRSTIELVDRMRHWLAARVQRPWPEPSPRLSHFEAALAACFEANGPFAPSFLPEQRKVPP